jgi:hypothetical protein
MTKKTTKRQLVKQKRLNAVARKLGHAAGTLTKVTRDLAESLSALPESVATKLREAADIDPPAERSRARAQHPRKRSRRSARAQASKNRATVEKRRSPKNKTLPGRQPAVHRDRTRE